MIEVFDNYLSPQAHQKLSNFLLKDGLCEWKFNDRKVSDQKNDDNNNYQFTHLFYTFHSLTGTARHITSKQIDILIPLLNKIGSYRYIESKQTLNQLKLREHIVNSIMMCKWMVNHCLP